MLVAVEVLFLGYFAVSAVMRTWALAVIPGLLAFAALVPWWLEQAVEARLPTWLHATYLAFLLAGPFAGGRLGLYAIWPHWDKAIHTLSGFLVGSTVFLGLGVIRRRNNLPLPPYLVGAAVMATGGFVAATWEIAEYTSDRLLGTHAQNASLDDTMTDIICGLLGAPSSPGWQHPMPVGTPCPSSPHCCATAICPDRRREPTDPHCIGLGVRGLPVNVRLVRRTESRAGL